MNHLGDTNKKVSDTPRTDAEAFYPHDSKEKVCDADFARILERELNAANDRIKRLEAELEQTKQDRNAIAKNTREPLLLQLDHANERIKRLEDRIHRASTAFFRDGSDGHVASQMLQILEEERNKR